MSHPLHPIWVPAVAACSNVRTSQLVHSLQMMLVPRPLLHLEPCPQRHSPPPCSCNLTFLKGYVHQVTSSLTKPHCLPVASGFEQISSAWWFNNSGLTECLHVFQKTEKKKGTRALSYLDISGWVEMVLEFSGILVILQYPFCWVLP